MSVRLINGDCREVLRTLPDASVQCCVTSPPYFGLRRYLDECDPDKALEIGAEITPDEYVSTLVGVFREVWRVLRDDGTFWLNLGDGYAGSGCGGFRPGAGRADGHVDDRNQRNRNGIPCPLGVKPKDLLGIPWTVAFALRADGWYLRSAITWAKPNPMPESCTDRPTNSYEMVFLMAKSGTSTYWTHRDLAGTRIQPAPDYRYIHRTTGEERTDDPGDTKDWRRINLWSGHDYFYDAEAISEDAESFGRKHTSKSQSPKTLALQDSGHHGRGGDLGINYERSHRNRRNVWTIGSKPFPGQHYATFPPELPERCIKAGTSEVGSCPHCGSPWERIIEKGGADREHQIACGGSANDGGYNGTALKDYAAAKAQNASDVKRRILEGMRSKRTTGWRPTCPCPEHAPVPCVVLDPFAGSGTTGMVADRLGRDAVLIELKQDGLAEDRITKDCPLFAEVVA